MDVSAKAYNEITEYGTKAVQQDGLQDMLGRLGDAVSTLEETYEQLASKVDPLRYSLPTPSAIERNSEDIPPFSEALSRLHHHTQRINTLIARMDVMRNELQI